MVPKPITCKGSRLLTVSWVGENGTGEPRPFVSSGHERSAEELENRSAPPHPHPPLPSSPPFLLPPQFSSFSHQSIPKAVVQGPAGNSVQVLGIATYSTWQSCISWEFVLLVGPFVRCFLFYFSFPRAIPGFHDYPGMPRGRRYFSCKTPHKVKSSRQKK